MDLEKFIKSQKDIIGYKIVDNKTVYYYTIEDFANTSTNYSKFWGKLFDLSYQKMKRLSDAVNSTEVWKNSYDGLNISQIEMNEWLNDTISRINKLISKDCKVLEIGCGNGLIFNSIIDNVSNYTGTDIAENGLELIANSKKGKLNTDKIELYQLDALNIDKLPENKFNLIIINSVAQYFPSLDYLFNVFSKLEYYASTNCFIFLGDIRSYELQNLFYLDILKTREPNLEDIELFNKINLLKIRENETFYHNNLFDIFPKIFDYIDFNIIELKNGKHINELNNYRYDVTLVCNTKYENSSIIYLNWESFQMPEEEISRQLKNLNNDEVLGIINIPNERYIKLKDKYKELFNPIDSLILSNSINQNNTIIPSLSYFIELAEKEKIYMQTKFDKLDFFKFTVYFSKKKSFNTIHTKSGINHKQLSNKLIEKKSSKDIELEEKFQKNFSEVELIKVSKYLLLE
jgi:2-polyprenyl-3-methyl-5-hydroxy-6-metoxy-1,4-benzoquinol methylase